MSTPDDTPPLARLACWSDWWFTPRWRALLTWLALAGLTVFIENASWVRFWALTQKPIALLNGLLAAPLPRVFNGIANGLTFWVLFTWFQPLALRLSLRRGLVWLGLPMSEVIVFQFLSRSFGFYSKWTWVVLEGAAAVLQCWILSGWRSRPWMCLPAWAVTIALAINAPLRHLYFVNWVETSIYQLPTAILLLYGTRLLRPEERARGA